MLRKMTAAAAAALVLGMAGQAGATVWTVTFKGTVLGGSRDDQNLFNHPGQSLDGLPFELVFTTTLPSSHAVLVDDPVNEYSMVSSNGAPGPTVADLTIDGAKVHLGGAKSTQVDQVHAPDQDFDAFDFSVSNGSFDGVTAVSNGIGVSAYGDGFLTSYQWQSLWGVVPLAGQTVFANFSFDTFDTRCGCGPITSGNLHIDSVFGASVPEPDVWALMLVGMAGVGTMLRRRRAAAHLAAA